MKIKNEKYAITIGVFNGVHIGHKQLIYTLKKSSYPPCVIILHPHPDKVIAKTPPPLITSLQERKEIIHKLGIKKVEVLKFDQKMRDLSPFEFCELLLEKYNIAELYCSEGFYFGKDKKGDITFLQNWQDKFLTKNIPTLKVDNIPVSSNRVRNLIREGKLTQANQLLGRYFSKEGKVEAGCGRGKKLLNYPTINISLNSSLMPLPLGVYAVYAKVKDCFYKGVANFGLRPSFTPSSDQPILEVHLFNFSYNIYNEMVKVYFVKYLRKERKFDQIKELQLQLDKDKISALTCL